MSDFKRRAHQLSVPSEPSDASPSPDLHEVRIALDFGATKIAIACHVAAQGTLSSSNEICMLRIQGKKSVPDVFAFVVEKSAWTIHWGAEFQKNDEAGLFVGKQKFVFRNLKACLSESRWKADKEATVKRELDRLGSMVGRDGLTVDWLMKQYLSKIHEVAEQAVDEHLSDIWSAGSDRKQVHRHWLFTVPQTSDKPANDWYIEILKAAGFADHVYLVPEAEAAAVWRLRKLFRRRNQAMFRTFQGSKEAIVLDGGGLTIHAVSVIPGGVDLPDEDCLVKLTLVKSDTKYCGSNTVNERFLHYIQQHASGLGIDLNGCSSITGITRSDLESWLSKEFDLRKGDFNGRSAINPIQMPDSLSSLESQEWARLLFPLSISREMMLGWFHETFSEISELIVGLRKGIQTKAVLLAGGLFQNQWLVDQVRQLCEKEGIEVYDDGSERHSTGDHCVAKGAVWRMPSHVQTEIGRMDRPRMGIARHEPHKQSVHGPIKDLTGWFHDNGIVYAPYRYRELLSQDSWDNASEGTIFSTTPVVYTLVAREDASGSLKFQLQEQVYCSYEHAAEHEYVDVDRVGREDYKFRKDGKPISKEIDLSLFKWTAATRKRQFGGDYRYEITVKLTVMLQDGKRDITWEVVKPRLLASRGDAPNKPEQVLQADTLHDKHFSSFPGRNPYVPNPGSTPQHPLMVEVSSSDEDTVDAEYERSETLAKSQSPEHQRYAGVAQRHTMATTPDVDFGNMPADVESLIAAAGSHLEVFKPRPERERDVAMRRGIESASNNDDLERASPRTPRGQVYSQNW